MLASCLKRLHLSSTVTTLHPPSATFASRQMATPQSAVHAQNLLGATMLLLPVAQFQQTRLV
jgi:hypothetical protein